MNGLFLLILISQCGWAYLCTPDWGTTQVVLSSVNYAATPATGATFSNGNIFTTWVEYPLDPLAPHIYQAHASILATNGTALVEHIVIGNPNSTLSSSLPSVVELLDGNIFAVFPTLDGIRGQLFFPDGTSEDPVIIANIHNTQYPNAILLKNGHIFVFWRQNAYSVYGRMVLPNGSPTSPVFNVTTVSSLQYYTAVALNNNQNAAAIIWGERDGTEYILSARIYQSNGNPLTDAFVIATFPMNMYAGIVPVASTLSNGNVLIIWNQDSGAASTDIKATFFYENGTVSPSQFTINDQTSVIRWNQFILQLRDGTYLVSWATNSETKICIYGKVLDAEGSPMGSDFALFTAAPYVALVPLKNGNIFTMSQKGDTDSGTVYGNIVLTNGFAGMPQAISESEPNNGVQSSINLYSLLALFSFLVIY